MQLSLGHRDMCSIYELLYKKLIVFSLFFWAVKVMKEFCLFKTIWTVLAVSLEFRAGRKCLMLWAYI